MSGIRFETRADETAVLELGNAAARELHRSRDVEEDRQVGVGVGLVLLHVEAIGPRVQPPVDAADVVAGDVAPVLGEVDRRPEKRRSMQTVDEPVDDRSREQVQLADTREHARIDEARPGDRPAFCQSSHG